MTTQEHALMIGLLATQLESLQAIADILKSRGIIDDDDLHAFFSIRSPEQRKQMVEKARLAYSLLAKNAGIDPIEAGILPSQ